MRVVCLIDDVDDDAARATNTPHQNLAKAGIPKKAPQARFLMQTSGDRSPTLLETTPAACLFLLFRVACFGGQPGTCSKRATANLATENDATSTVAWSFGLVLTGAGLVLGRAIKQRTSRPVGD